MLITTLGSGSGGDNCLQDTHIIFPNTKLPRSKNLLPIFTTFRRTTPNNLLNPTATEFWVRI